MEVFWLVRATYIFSITCTEKWLWTTWVHSLVIKRMLGHSIKGAMVVVTLHQKISLWWNFGVLNQGFREFLVILLDVCMINILAWNIRRVIGWTMYCLIKDLIIKYHIDLMALFETKVNDNKAYVILSHLRLDYWFKVDTLGFFSGIWLLWDSSIIYVVVRHDNLIGPRKYSSNFPRFWWKTCFDRGWGSCFPELMKSSSIVSSLNLNGVVCMTMFCLFIWD